MPPRVTVFTFGVSGRMRSDGAVSATSGGRGGPLLLLLRVAGQRDGAHQPDDALPVQRPARPARLPRAAREWPARAAVGRRHVRIVHGGLLSWLGAAAPLPLLQLPLQ